MEQKLLDMSKYYRMLHLSDLYSYEGKISKIVGMTVEAAGLICSIGDICRIKLGKGAEDIICEVVGISDNKAFLMPYQEIDGIGYGCPVVNTGPVSYTHLDVYKRQAAGWPGAADWPEPAWPERTGSGCSSLCSSSFP